MTDVERHRGIGTGTGTNASADRRADEVELVEGVMRFLDDEFSPRRATTPSERAAQQWVAEGFEALGLPTTSEPFTFTDNLYAVLALSFGVGALGTTIAGRRPRLGAALGLLGAGSYWLDSTKRTEVLRRAFPYRPSQNVLARLRADGEPTLRIVYLAHIDAALTGLLFEPWFLRTFTHKGTKAPYPSRSLAVATQLTLAASAFAAVRSVVGPRGRPLRWAERALSIPAWLTFLLNLDVVLRNRTVPGAADNLSGVAGSLLLAGRLSRDSQRDRRVEHVFVITGAEEAGTGGARRLLAEHRQDWSTANTVIIGLDTLCNGDLFWVQEGEQRLLPLDPSIEAAAERVAAADPRFVDVRRFQIPVGSSDVAPFLYGGYPGMCLSCVDLEQGAPRHYHHPTDTPANADAGAVVDAIDFAEALVREIQHDRLSRAG